MNESTPALFRVGVVPDNVIDNLPELFQAIYNLSFFLMCKVISSDIIFITCADLDFNLKYS